jgi:hypothetical protein
VSESGAAHARRRVRTVRDFVSPEAVGAPIYLYREGEGTGAGARFRYCLRKSVLKFSTCSRRFESPKDMQNLISSDAVLKGHNLTPRNRFRLIHA